MEVEEQAESAEGGEQRDSPDTDSTPALQEPVPASAAVAELNRAESEEMDDFATAAAPVTEADTPEHIHEEDDSAVSSTAAVEAEVNSTATRGGATSGLGSIENVRQEHVDWDAVVASTNARVAGFQFWPISTQRVESQSDSNIASERAAPNIANHEGDGVVSSTAEIPVEQRGFQFLRMLPQRPELLPMPEDFLRYQRPAPTTSAGNVPEADDIEIPNANDSRSSESLEEMTPAQLRAATLSGSSSESLEEMTPEPNEPMQIGQLVAADHGVSPLGLLDVNFLNPQPPLELAGLPELVPVERAGSDTASGGVALPLQFTRDQMHEYVRDLFDVSRAEGERGENAVRADRDEPEFSDTGLPELVPVERAGSDTASGGAALPPSARRAGDERMREFVANLSRGRRDEGERGENAVRADRDELEFSDTDSTDDELAPNRWRMPSSDVSVQAAIRELIDRGRRTEGGFFITRENFMQRMRRIMFSYNHRRRRHSRAGGDAYFDEDARSEPDELDPAREEPQAQPAPANAIRFDTNLPAEHSYMGNMNRVSGVNYLDVGQSHDLMLFQHAHILFPGDVLPFMICGLLPEEADIDAQNGVLFGVCFPHLRTNEQDDIMYGVTCQIYERGTDDRGNTTILSRVLQRFTTKFSQINGILNYIASAPTQSKCHGTVKILPEIYLPEPLSCINMGSMNRFRGSDSMQQTFKRYQAATTPFQAHTFEYYSMSAVVETARTLLAQHKIDTMPTEPVQLSFWLVRNLHLNERMMKRIFMTDCVNTRMKLIQSTFKADSLFVCRYCGNRIANCRELFAMSKHGVQTQYCNSAGYIHETNTVYTLVRNAVTYSGRPSSEFSWFPGYQWHIIVCRVCTRHIGWEFKALEENLVPAKFFGISGTSVRITSPASVEQNPAAAMFENILTYAQTNMQ